VTIDPFGPGDIEWAEALLGGMGGRLQARRGAVVDALACPGLVARRAGRPVGILTHDQGEIVYLQAAERGQGVGTALLRAFLAAVPVRPVWLVTTNDNVDALRFYQRRGFSIAEVRVGAVTEARRHLKPTIPELGDYGIPITDEIELVLTR
jgi:ribosomal protein S18 acetylase RimI-like enzyme